MLHGNAVIGQSGGPTAAINASLAGVIRGALAAECIDKIWGAFNGVEGMLSGRMCDLRAILSCEDELELLSHTPAAALGSCRRKLSASGEGEDYERLFKMFAENNIRYFFYIGGNDSMDTVAKVTSYAEKIGYKLRVMGVPKTIDNDVCGTDHTPGYGSAAKYIAASVQEILRDCAVYTVKAVTIVEIMGRDAGWLTAAAGLPRLRYGIAPDYIYLPERTFDLDSFTTDVMAALERRPNIVIAASEGLRLADGTYVGECAQSGACDAFGHRYLAGTAKVLEQAVKEKIGCKTRSVELNILQRCASHIASETDLREASMIGRAAVEFAISGETGKMMGFERVSDEPYRVAARCGDIKKIANLIRKMPDEFINADGNNVTDECLRYIEPLVMGEPKLAYEGGLPKHFIIPR
mgnify:CR=1 FL=1